MTKRNYVRITSYIIFALVVLIAFVIMNTRSMTTYKSQLELTYQQSLTELSECLDKVNTDLTKSLYSNSSGEIYDVSRDLYAQCSTAKDALSRLPVSQMELNNTYKFLSQASDYAQYIGTKIENNEEITDEEHKNLYTLLEYAQKFSSSTNDMVDIVQNGGKITENEVINNSEISVSALSNSFSVSAKTFEDFPTLLYDGPFSDQILNKKSALVSSADVKTRDECKSIAAKAIGVSKSRMNYETDEQSVIPCYTYKCGRYTVSVTKQGGYIKSILYSSTVKEASITPQSACKVAIEYLNSIGFSDMKQSYYNVSDNICTINCAYAKDDVYYYSDLIKVGVSLSDGKIVSLDTTTYLTNHIEREAFSAKIKITDAQKLISPYLNVKSTKKCVIPKESGKEVQCFEFTCESTDTGEQALVYINAQTGDEEDIMLLLSTDNGTLVK